MAHLRALASRLGLEVRQLVALAGVHPLCGRWWPGAAVPEDVPPRFGNAYFRCARFAVHGYGISVSAAARPWADPVPCPCRSLSNTHIMANARFKLLLYSCSSEGISLRTRFSPCRRVLLGRTDAWLLKDAEVSAVVAEFAADDEAFAKVRQPAYSGIWHVPTPLSAQTH